MSKIVLIAAALCGLVLRADTTIRMKMSSGKGPSQETAMFTKGARPEQRHPFSQVRRRRTFAVQIRTEGRRGEGHLRSCRYR